MRRKWLAILTDAKKRGLSRVELARELGVGRGQVNNACMSNGVSLPLAPRYQRGRPGPRDDAERQKVSDRNRVRWERRFSDCPPGLTINALCLRFGTGYDATKAWAAALGYDTAPAKDRRAA